MGVDLIKNCRSAFTLIEIMLVVVVVGMVATIIPKWLIKKEPSSEWPVVLDQFDDLIYYARQEAVATQNNYRLSFKQNVVDPDFVVVEQEESDPEDFSKKIYKQVFSEYFDTKYELPDSIKMQKFYRSKKNEFEENKGNAYCYIIPNGLVQPGMIHLLRKVEDREERVTFKIAPFLGKFEFVEGFLRPEK